MKEFLMEFNKDSTKYDFVDKQDRNSFREFLSFIKGKGVQKFIMKIEPYNGDKSTDKQVNLWNFILNFIANESGNDINTIRETLNNKNVSVEDMTKQEFSDLLEYSFSICKEYFGISLTINKYGNIEQIKE